MKTGIGGQATFYAKSVNGVVRSNICTGDPLCSRHGSREKGELLYRYTGQPGDRALAAPADRYEIPSSPNPTNRVS
jgi:hypothetical protein